VSSLLSDHNAPDGIVHVKKRIACIAQLPTDRHTWFRNAFCLIVRRSKEILRDANLRVGCSTKFESFDGVPDEKDQRRDSDDEICNLEEIVHYNRMVSR
jgi:hypothetical protein